MTEGRLGYRAINMGERFGGARFRFRVKKLDTEFLFQDGSVHIFPNWDVKGYREQFYMDEYVNVPTDEYLRVASDSGVIIEHGITTADIRNFIERKADFFEDLLLGFGGGDGLEGPGCLNSEENT